MKQNKWAIIVVSPITVVALLLAWIFDKNEYGFWSNVFLGVFGSGLLTTMVAVINYITERRTALETFWTQGHKAARNFNRYPLDGTDNEKADAVLLMNEFDFQSFGDAYAAIDFLFGNKKARKRIYSELYSPIRDIGHKLALYAAKISRLRRYAPENVAVLQSYIKELDEIFIEEYTGKYAYQDSATLTVTNRCNKLTDMCYDRFSGFYWKIMYPLKKQEEKENAD